MAVTDYENTVNLYIENVISGILVTGRLQQLAVKRYLRDVERAESMGIYFDKKAANFACNFTKIFNHTKGGQFANKKVELEPWQLFCTWNIFGWKRKSDNLRRFNRAYINVAAKAGKTTWIAALLLLGTIADSPLEPGAESYIVAPTHKQAKICFSQVVDFIESVEFLKANAKVYRGNPIHIKWKANNGTISPIVIGPNLDGINASFIVRDELHALRETHREGCGKLLSRMAARQQPLMIDITTAGSDASLLWEEEHKIAVTTVESVETEIEIDESYFSFICTIDEKDDPFDESVWVKANPNIGVTVSYDYYRQIAKRAAQLPTELSDFLRYQCNVKSSATNRAIMPKDWAKGNAPVQHALWDSGRGGVDLSRTRDFTAISAVFPIADSSGKTIRWEVISKSWVCSDGRLRLDREPFKNWIYEGKLHVIDGDRILYDEIEEEIVRWSEVYNVVQWAFDPNRAAELMDRLKKKGIDVFPFNQSHTKYNESCERFQDEVLSGNIIHGNDPVLTWQIGNLEYITKENGLVMPNKRNIASKIDAACATLMGFQGCLFAENNSLDYYENNQVEMG